MTETLTRPNHPLNPDDMMLSDAERVRLTRERAQGMGTAALVTRVSLEPVGNAQPDEAVESVIAPKVPATEETTDDLTPEQRAVRDSLESMRWELTELAQQLKEPIENETYDSLIGDDISGRLPTMFMYRLMQRHAQDSSTRPPNIIFAAPDKDPRLESAESWDMEAAEQARQEKNANLKQYFQKQESMGRLGKRSLLVTEMIATGENLMDILGNVPGEQPVDVATLIKSPFFDHERQMDLIGDAAFYVGSVGQAEYHQGKITGRAKSGVEATTHRAEDYDPEVTEFAYAYTQKMADEVYDEVFKQQAELSDSYDY